MFRVMNADGQQIAAPAARTELETYLNTSWPGWKDQVFDHRDENNFSISDTKGQMIASVTGPKPPPEPRDERGGGLQP